MERQNTYRIINYLIALVWLANGVLCKLLNLVPRHQEIIGQLLNEPYSRQLTVLIGFGEVFIALWHLSKFQSKLNALFQIFLVITMNIIEATLVPDLLLWGKVNLIFSILFCILVFINVFILNPEIKNKK